MATPHGKSDDVVTFDIPFAAMSSPEAAAWRGWFEAHGVDPELVALPARVERREAERQLVFEAYQRDEHGRPVAVDEQQRRVGGQFAGGQSATGDHAAREVRVVQLEEPPLPWPVDPHLLDTDRYRWGNT